MLVRIYQVLVYILFCLCQRVAPWKYYQLNAQYFNQQRGIFSKLDTDLLIPNQWRLHQFLDIDHAQPQHYPVFVKPEWGQNSFGVQRADNAQQLAKIRDNRQAKTGNYLIQQAAPGASEFEIFVIPAVQESQNPVVLSLTETLNSSDEKYPVNGIYNQATAYQDLSEQLTAAQQKKLWGHLKLIGQFRLSRIGLRADSLEDLVNGDFKVIEINLLYPMPLMLLSENRTWLQKNCFIWTAMWRLAAITKTIPATAASKSIFFKKLKLAYRLKLPNKLDTRHERA